MCFIEEFKHFLGKIHSSPRKVFFFLKELGPFPKENSLLLWEVIFSTREIFLLHGELAWD
jgi:hypothetical protein